MPDLPFSPTTSMNLPYARYYLTGSQAAPASNNNILNFNTLSKDPYSSVATGSNWLYTVPITGIYIVSFSIFYASAVWATTSLSQLAILNNSSIVSVPTRWLCQVATANTYNLQLSAIDYVPCNRNDQLQTYAYHSNVNAPAITDGGTPNYFTYITIALLTR